MIPALHLVALGGYTFAWAAQLRAFRRGEESPGAGWRAAGIAWLLHAAALVLFGIAFRTLPLVGLGPASSSLALTIALFVLVASVREDARAAGLFVLPVVMLLLGEALVVGIETTPQQTEFRGLWFVSHVTTIFVGYAGLLLASSAAGMYLLQFRALKRKRFGSVFGFFPSLDTLDWLHRLGLWIGFPALTVGLVAGWSWTLTYGQGLALGDGEVLFGVVTWFTYLGAIGVRLRTHGRETAAALASTGALFVMLAAFTVVRLAGGGSGFFL